MYKAYKQWRARLKLKMYIYDLIDIRNKAYKTGNVDLYDKLGHKQLVVEEELRLMEAERIKHRAKKIGISL